ncbi:thioesterase superfamily protein [Ceratobasidium sp. AG-Ba]|nr:thioesterase superfamily protein [Ceratobasidium sp. AG-Ba]
MSLSNKSFLPTSHPDETSLDTFSHTFAHEPSSTHTQYLGWCKRTRGGAAAVLAVSVASASYIAGSLYPPTTLQLISPPPAPPAPALGTEEAVKYTAVLEEKLQNLSLVKELRKRQGWYESRPYQDYPEDRRRHALTSGSLRGPGKLALPPIVFAKEDESEPSHSFTLARNALLNLPAKVGVTANLSINYRAPTKADQFIYIHTHVDKAQGRKVTVSGEVHSVETGELLVTARYVTSTGYGASPNLSNSALFVQPKYAHLLNAGGAVEKLLGSNNNPNAKSVGPEGKQQNVKVPQEAAV